MNSSWKKFRKNPQINFPQTCNKGNMELKNYSIVIMVLANENLPHALLDLGNQPFATVRLLSHEIRQW
jgi:hypothetical protein